MFHVKHNRPPILLFQLLVSASIVMVLCNRTHCKNYLNYFIRHSQERWRRIVMSMSLCVCLSAISRTAGAIFSSNNFCACCLSPWLGPPPAGWLNPKGKGQFWGFSSPLTMHCTSAFGLGPIRKRLNRSSGRSVISTVAFIVLESNLYFVIETF